MNTKLVAAHVRSVRAAAVLLVGIAVVGIGIAIAAPVEAIVP